MANYLSSRPPTRDAGSIYAQHSAKHSQDYSVNQESSDRQSVYQNYTGDNGFQGNGVTVKTVPAVLEDGGRGNGISVQVDHDKTPVLSEQHDSDGSVSPADLSTTAAAVKPGTYLTQKSTLLSPFVPGSGAGGPAHQFSSGQDQYVTIDSPSRANWHSATTLSTPSQPYTGGGDEARTAAGAQSAVSTPYGGPEHGYSSQTPTQQDHQTNSLGEPGQGQNLPSAMTYQPFQFRPSPANMQIETFQAPAPAGLNMPPYPYVVTHQVPSSLQGYQPHPAETEMAIRAQQSGQPLEYAFQYSHGQMAPGAVHSSEAQYHYAQAGHVQTLPQGAHLAPLQAHGMQDQNGHPGVVFARSSDVKVARPKVKLTYDDKRRIVEIANSNTNLRQEDIAQQYGYVLILFPFQSAKSIMLTALLDSVDRSTISKILIQAHRWTGPPQPPVVPIPKPTKPSGGRFPAIEHEMLKWWDAQEASGREVRDTTAREHAKAIARMMGFGEDRFKASAKWLDKFKERRRRPYSVHQQGSSHEGSPMSYSGTATPHSGMGSSFPGHHPQQSFYLHPTQYYGHPSGYNTPSHSNISRSQSSVTLASMDSGYVAHPNHGSHPSHPSGWNDSEHAGMHESISDISNVSSALHSRQRSRSSPQRNGPLDPTNPGSLDPASGRAPRSMTSGLQRSQSTRVGGVSPSPRRPTTLHRTQSSTSSISSRRGNRPTSLAASAFGLTPMHQPEANGSRAHTPAHGTPSQTPDRRTSDESSSTQMRPFTTSMYSMNISPAETMSSAGTLTSSSSTNSIQQHALSGPLPITPIAPNGQFMEYRSIDSNYPSAYQSYHPSQAASEAHRQQMYSYPGGPGYQQPVSQHYDAKLSSSWRPEN